MNLGNRRVLCKIAYLKVLYGISYHFVRNQIRIFWVFFNVTKLGKIHKGLIFGFVWEYGFTIYYILTKMNNQIET